MLIIPKHPENLNCEKHNIPLVEYSSRYRNGPGSAVCLECDFSFEGIKEGPVEAFLDTPQMRELRELRPPPPPITSDISLFLKGEVDNKGFNPYLDDMLKLKPNEVSLWNMSRLHKYDVHYLTDFFVSEHYREKWVYKYGFAIPCLQALKAIKAYSPIIELGAGSGYWAYLLDQMDCDIIAYDKKDPHYATGHSWFDVAPGDQHVLPEYPDSTLFLCWPPMSDMAEECVKAFKGQHIIYIGEGHGGCTASDGFFEEIEEHWDYLGDVGIPCWPGIRDSVEIFKRKTTKNG